MPSDEQTNVVQHRSDRHGRVLAGPGTGKSTTVLQLAARLQGEGVAVRAITFTRAATGELAKKIKDEGHVIVEPVTVHGFALSILMRNPGATSLPEPLRIPDGVETDLIHKDIAARLRDDGFENLKAPTVRKLEQEMASAWESLDPNETLIADVAPELRNRYLSVWNAHRRVFGYSLFAEMPLYAKQLIEDRSDLNIGKLEMLIVDEFQDLNKCEIALMAALARRGVKIVAVGDDDQSIYSFRMAHPPGILDFPTQFIPNLDHSLSVSFRCAQEILVVAKTLIEATPGRAYRPAIRESPSQPHGTFEYLRFENQDEEREGIARLAAHLITKGMKPSEICILMRADSKQAWSSPLRKALAAYGVPATDVESALEPLETDNARRLLSIARLAETRLDDLAWWSLLLATPRISEDFITVVADECIKRSERFALNVSKLESEPPPGVTTQSLNAAIRTINETVAVLSGLDLKEVPPSENGWADWLLGIAEKLKIPVAEDFRALLLAVGRITPHAEGLRHYLNQLEPVTKDLAVKTEGVAIMTMARSKGLTFRAAIVLGVERGVIPLPRARDENEERRLLYVAMTRPREYLYLTMARKRTDNTAFSGGVSLRDRSRCPFFETLGISPSDGREYLRKLGSQPRR